jgi:hypothetical protein
MSKLLEPPPAIVEAVVRYECPRCGSSCECGIPYVAKTMRAAEAIAANPEKSNRAIAEEIGVSEPTVRRARASYDAPEAEAVTGRDGKSYPATQPKPEPKPVNENMLIASMANGPINEIRHGLQKLSADGRKRLREIALEAWTDKTLNEPDTIMF